MTFAAVRLEASHYEKLQAILAEFAAVDSAALPPVIQDAIDLLVAVWKLSGAVEPNVPRVKRLSPFIHMPWSVVVLRTPIREYLAGNAEEAFQLTPRATHYLLYRSLGTGLVHVADLQEPQTVKSIQAGASLETLLEESADVERTLEYLLNLASAGIIVWLRPRKPIVNGARS